MAFTAKKSDGSIAAVVNDYESTIAGGLKLLGYGYVNYSEEIASNFVQVAENFANATPPQNPLKGQLWWNTSNGSQPSLWVCRDPTAAASPTTARWSMIFQVNAGSGNVDAWTLRSLPPSTTSVANTVVVRDGSGKIDVASLPGSLGATNLDGLTDVQISSPSFPQAVLFNGTQWVNANINLSHISNVNTTGAVNGSILKFNGTDWVVGVDAVGSAGSTATWGGITGTVTNQTDLVNYINGKTWAQSSVVGLVSALAGKVSWGDILASDGSGSSLDADLLDGHDGSYYLSYANMTGSLPSGAVTSSSSYNPSSGYVVIGGFIVQWGRVFVAGGGADANFNVSYPTTFPNGSMIVLATPAFNLDPNDDSNDETWWTNTVSNSQFNIQAEGDRPSGYFNWIALGY
jgi:hypothetical protein